MGSLPRSKPSFISQNPDTKRIQEFVEQAYPPARFKVSISDAPFNGLLISDNKDALFPLGQIETLGALTTLGPDQDLQCIESLNGLSVWNDPRIHAPKGYPMVLIFAT